MDPRIRIRTKMSWIRNTAGSQDQNGTVSRILNTGKTKKETLAWIPAATAAAQTATIRRLRTEWALALVPPARRPSKINT
jgi:hypothetical protein